MFIVCPYCGDYVEINIVRCGKFIHGVNKKTRKPVNPHTSVIDCERFIRKGLIYGCGQPFQLTLEGEQYIASKAPYG